MTDREECLQIFEYASVADVPMMQLEYPVGPNCREAWCRRRHERNPSDYARVFCFSEPSEDPYPLSAFSAMVRLADYPDYGAFRDYVRRFSDGERLRLVRRAEASGYLVEHCNLLMHTADRYELHTSKSERQDKPIFGTLAKTIDEMGGLPTHYVPPPEAPPCVNYWQRAFGVFLREPGHKQGEVVVDKRMVGYINLNRDGNWVCYGAIVGHGDHLAFGIMDLCHHHIMRILLDERPTWAAGVECVLYANMEGRSGVFQWKRRAGFRPYRVFARAVAARCGGEAAVGRSDEGMAAR